MQNSTIKLSHLNIKTILDLNPKLSIKNIYNLYSLFLCLADLSKRINQDNSLKFKNTFMEPKINQTIISDKVNLDLLFKSLDIFKSKNEHFCREILRAIGVIEDDWQVITWEKFVELHSLFIYQTANKIQQTNFVMNLLNWNHLTKISKDDAFQKIKEIYMKSKFFSNVEVPKIDRKIPEYLKMNIKPPIDPIHQKFTKFWRNLQLAECINENKEVNIEKMKKAYEIGKADANSIISLIYDDDIIPAN